MYLAAQRLVRSRRAAMLAAAPLAAWPTGKCGQADQRRSSAAAQPASVIKMALVCLPLLLLCSTVVVPPAALVVPWAKRRRHGSPRLFPPSWVTARVASHSTRNVRPFPQSDGPKRVKSGAIVRTRVVTASRVVGLAPAPTPRLPALVPTQLGHCASGKPFDEKCAGISAVRPRATGERRHALWR